MRRHTIAGLMLTVLVCAVAVAALRDASETWAGILLSLTLLALGTSLIGVLHRREGKRAFWQGFALFGWGYLVLSQAPWFAEQVGPKLPSTALLGYAHGRLNPATGNVTGQFQDVFFSLGTSIDATSAGAATNPSVAVQPQPPPQGAVAVDFDFAFPTTPAPSPKPQLFTFFLAGTGNRDQFFRVGHCLFTLLAALLGGMIARWFHRTNREAVQQTHA
jgi:hypothetical protein